MNHIKIPRYITWQKLNDYVYIIDERSSHLTLIDELGMDIWLSIVKYSDTKKVIEYINSNYYVEEGKEISDMVKKFIRDLMEEGLIYGYN